MIIKKRNQITKLYKLVGPDINDLVWLDHYQIDFWQELGYRAVRV
jgi:hypothetical protein